MPQMTPAEARDLYVRWVGRTGMEATSKQVYSDRVTRFLTWLEAQGSEYADALVDEHARDYAARDYRRILLTVEKLAPRTVAQHMSAIGSFYEWRELGRPRGVGVDVPPGDKLGLTEKDLVKLLRATQRRSARDFAITSTLCNAGARVAELVAVDVDDLELRDRGGSMAIRYGKGGRPRSVPLNPQVRDALRSWLDERRTRPGADTPALWLARGGARLSVRSVQSMLHSTGAEVGVKVTPHVLRHTFGRRNIEAGTDIESLRQMFGHKSIVTTQAYIHSRTEDLEAAVNRIGVEL